METNNNKIKANDNNKVIAGFVIVGVGVILLLRTMGFLFPHWLFTWPVLLIVAGIFTGFKNNFQKQSWIVMVAIGSFFLLKDFVPELRIGQYFWPLLIIGIGLGFIFTAGFKKKDNNSTSILNDGETTYESNSQTLYNDDSFAARAFFSSTNQFVISKNFKGGNISTTFGSSDIDLSKCNFYGTATINIDVTFGSADLIVPNDWLIKNEVNGFFNSVEDKRTTAFDQNKVLIIKGNCVFGSVDVKGIK